jgi:hypothetical protein
LTFEGITHTGPKALTLYENVDNSNNSITLMLRVGLLKLKATRWRRLKTMKIVALCKEGSCCPVVKITDSQVEIGEKDNTCVLTMKEWEILKEKILNQEL